jgi:hypothetical protein
MVHWRRSRELPLEIQLEVETLLSDLRGGAPVAFGLGKEANDNAASGVQTQTLGARLGRLGQWLLHLPISWL